MWWYRINVACLSLAMVALLVGRGCVVRVAGDSMVPALRNGDYCIVAPTWVARSLSSGRVVTFREPGATNGRSVKRIVAVAGSCVVVKQAGTGLACVRDGVSGRILGRGLIVVGGDNESVSHDSRNYGPVREAEIEGVALAVVWPPRHAGYVSEEADGRAQ